MTEPLFIFSESERAFAELLPTRTVEQLTMATLIYKTVILPTKDTPGVRRELAMLEAEIDRRG